MGIVSDVGRRLIACSTFCGVEMMIKSIRDLESIERVKNIFVSMRI